MAKHMIVLDIGYTNGEPNDLDARSAAYHYAKRLESGNPTKAREILTAMDAAMNDTGESKDAKPAPTVPVLPKPKEPPK